MALDKVHLHWLASTGPRRSSSSEASSRRSRRAGSRAHRLFAPEGGARPENAHRAGILASRVRSRSTLGEWAAGPATRRPLLSNLLSNRRSRARRQAATTGIEGNGRPKNVQINAAGCRLLPLRGADGGNVQSPLRHDLRSKSPGQRGCARPTRAGFALRLLSNASSTGRRGGYRRSCGCRSVPLGAGRCRSAPCRR